MRCSIKGCYEATITTKSVITIGLREPSSLKVYDLVVGTGWCEKHAWAERGYELLCEMLKGNVELP